MSLLKVRHLSKTYEHQVAVNNFSLSLKSGQILCLLGPSGCGKTTLLRLVAGLEMPDTGHIFYLDKDITDTPAHRRRFGMMFQEYALFPHKSVFDNVAFGLTLLKRTPERIYQETMTILGRVGMSSLSRRRVTELSGGERQRVALARSLAPHPRMLMLDEPLGSLDRSLRERLLGEILTILKKMEMTAIFVTHDQSEALAVADRIAVMNNGRLEQVASPEILYRKPENQFVARFLGITNLIPGTIDTNGRVTTSIGHFNLPKKVGTPENKEITLILRPEGARLSSTRSTKGNGPTLTGKLIKRQFAGQTYRIEMTAPDQTTLNFDLPNEPPPPMIGDSVSLDIALTSVSFIPGRE